VQRHQLKVRMCCAKCEEKVVEEIWEVRGVFDVMASRVDKTVVVTGMPERAEALAGGFEGTGRGGYLDTDEVLRKARKVDCRARFVRLDHPVVAVQKPQNPNPKPPNPKPDVRPQQPDLSMHPVNYPPPGYATAHRPDPPYAYFRDPAQDDNTPFYFLRFLILLLSLLVFRK
jgi:hypothetical protein